MEEVSSRPFVVTYGTSSSHLTYTYSYLYEESQGAKRFMRGQSHWNSYESSTTCSVILILDTHITYTLSF